MSVRTKMRRSFPRLDGVYAIYNNKGFLDYIFIYWITKGEIILERMLPS